MKNVVLGLMGVLFAAACCLPGQRAPQVMAFDSPLYGESPLVASFESPLPTSTSVFATYTPVFVFPTVTPKFVPPVWGNDPPVDEPVYELLFPMVGGD